MSRTRLILFGLLGLILVLLFVLSSTGTTVSADSRINCHAASPIVIYCDDAGIWIYTIDGQELLKISAADMAAAELPAPGGGTLLGSADNLWVHLLADGQYRVAYFNTERDEWFTVTWAGCGLGTAGTGDIKVYDAAFETLISDADGCGGDGGPTCVSALACTAEYAICFEDTEGADFCAEMYCYDSCDGPNACQQCVDANGPVRELCGEVCNWERPSET